MRRVALACALSGLTACSKGPDQQGVQERFRVRAADDKSPPAQFIEGKLPGARPKNQVSPPPPAGDAGTRDAGSGGPPQIIDHTTVKIAYAGQTGVNLHGTTTANAAAVGIALDGISNGYWVLPVADPDTFDHPNWAALCDFDEAIPPGYRSILSVALDATGEAGDQQGNFVCIASPVPDNFSSCFREGERRTSPPNAVISLSWDTNVDLDLQVETPDGRLIDSKHPVVTLPNDAGKFPNPNKIDQIDRDSNAGCVTDGIRREDLVWEDAKPSGTYRIYVNLFDACKQPIVHFRVEIYAAVEKEDGGSRLQRFYPEQSDPPGGELLDIAANAGTARGMFFTKFNF